MHKTTLNLPTEIKPIEGFPRYGISKDGSVFSFNFHRTGKIKEMKLRYDKDGYQTVALWTGRGYKTVKVHRLVAAAFIDNPENKPQVNHKNGIKNHNVVGNLEWVTASENALHSYKIGLSSVTEANKKAVREWRKKTRKLSDKQIRQIRSEYAAGGISYAKLGDKFKVSLSVIANIVQFKLYKDVS